MFRYQITAGNTAGAFSLDINTGELRVASSAAIDASIRTRFDLEFTVSDGEFTTPGKLIILVRFFVLLGPNLMLITGLTSSAQ